LLQIHPHKLCLSAHTIAHNDAMVKGAVFKPHVRHEVSYEHEQKLHIRGGDLHVIRGRSCRHLLLVQAIQAGPFRVEDELPSILVDGIIVHPHEAVLRFLHPHQVLACTQVWGMSGYGGCFLDKVGYHPSLVLSMERVHRGLDSRVQAGREGIEDAGNAIRREAMAPPSHHIRIWPSVYQHEVHRRSLQVIPNSGRDKMYRPVNVVVGSLCLDEVEGMLSLLALKKCALTCCVCSYLRVCVTVG
jgi:hypothetical protein